MVLEMNDFDLTDEEIELFIKNVNKLLDMDYNDLFNILKYIMCKYPKTLYAVQKY